MLEIAGHRMSGEKIKPPENYLDLLTNATRRPPHWVNACTHTESTFHQLSPYIGKLKSSIARDLIQRYSRPGDIIIDPFAGSGTIPLEAVLLDRRVIAFDASLYAVTLTKGKLGAPARLDRTLSITDDLLMEAERNPLPDLRRVPKWARTFFHPRTLKEAFRFAQVAKEANSPFILSCLLGILHHQRPGFLSYPSSHLVPYLRNNKYPRDKYPELYTYRALRPRLEAKIERAFKRPPSSVTHRRTVTCEKSRVQDIRLSKQIDCLITSPPYMNALDYGRDNRLRLWFLGEQQPQLFDRKSNGREEFREAIRAVACNLEKWLRPGGYALFIVGEHDARGIDNYPSAEVATIMNTQAPSVGLKEVIADVIPDVRRSRRRLSGVKKEHVLVYQKR
ncbi:DNA methyltransferase [Candidatus Thiosymbion oneisti]|uniref:DNA methyltransferase n=1 Tax=Candidatus Thiosymbion oneisti TaxID=589554 RepID=UPI000AAB28D9|nr:DNA methyltransferase [Candidatus Thiosymbion oneisti]